FGPVRTAEALTRTALGPAGTLYGPISDRESVQTFAGNRADIASRGIKKHACGRSPQACGEGKKKTEEGRPGPRGTIPHTALNRYPESPEPAFASPGTVAYLPAAVLANP